MQPGFGTPILGINNVPNPLGQFARYHSMWFWVRFDMKLVGNTGGIWFRRYGGGLVHSDYFEWSMKLANANRV